VIHHNRQFIAAADAERRAAGQRRRPAADADEVTHLMRAAARGEGAGWNALVKRFATSVRRVARTYRISPHDVDDVLQTTWLRLFEHIHSLNEPAAVGAWLETTARRESLRVLRGAKRVRPTDEEWLFREVAEPVADDDLIDAERRASLVASVGRLPPGQRQLIAALLVEPTLPYAEISRSLGTPIGSIGPTRARSLARLRRDPELRRAFAEEG
jgi:RNA polymerase sigma factor (sigma-70 family)